MKALYSLVFFLLYTAGRSVRWFNVLAINSTCVSLSWSLLDNSSVPLFMVVQWSPQRQQDSEHHKGQSAETWARLPYTDRPIYLRGNTISSVFSLIYFSVLTVCYCKRASMLSHHDFNVSFQVISLALRSVASTCTLCLLMEKGSQCTLQVCPTCTSFRAVVSASYSALKSLRMTQSQYFHCVINYRFDVYFFQLLQLPEETLQPT